MNQSHASMAAVIFRRSRLAEMLSRADSSAGLAHEYAVIRSDNILLMARW